MGLLVSGLATRGKLIVVGAPADPIQLNVLPLLFGGRLICGSLTGTPIDSEDTLVQCPCRRVLTHKNRIIGFICPFLPPREIPKCPSIRKMVGRGGGDRNCIPKS
jgi:hypothetical protein